MKIITVLGTRPEIIRLSRILPKLDELCDHILIHTGQNYDKNLNDIFFEELGLRAPDYVLQSQSSTIGGQIGKILAGCEEIFLKEKPDRILLLGDTNSSLCAIIATRMGIPVYHMEAGNRCFDDRVPEEVNRRIIDHSSEVLMPYTEGSRQNLLREGIDSKRVLVTGNPIFEVIDYFKDKIDASTILNTLELKEKKYILVTTHRAENVDIEERLFSIVKGLDILSKTYDMPVIISTHPRTRSKMEKYGLNPSTHSGLQFLDPFGFFDFIKLEKSAFCVLSDSGTVQEECAILGVPNITMRDVTERPETQECGSNFLAGANSDMIASGVKTVLTLGPPTRAPSEYLVKNVSDIVVRITLGYYYK
ncbi:MAG: UDP-N-acetylglucosamine 2-epimerase (non-hydrolyzing) [Bacteroidales bacterium]|nr:UDP-N-acetylglucosamine 2-epimerase (non-hydrolyzing) [Bacteroidales bacterium]